MNDANKTYFQRQLIQNQGEQIFEQYCLDNHYKYKRLGFDEKNNSITHFYRLNTMLRNIPDYIVDIGDCTYIVNVKGTANFKQSEIDLMPLFIEWYSSKKAPLVYAFCFKENKKPFTFYPEQIISRYEKEKNQVWHDGVIYRKLNFD